jgi:hypothetical protein
MEERDANDMPKQEQVSDSGQVQNKNPSNLEVVVEQGGPQLT